MMVYNWFNAWKKKGKDAHTLLSNSPGKPSKIDTNPTSPPSLSQATTEPEGRGSPSNRLGSPKLLIETGTEPELPPETKTPEQTADFQQTQQQQNAANPYGELRFIKLLSSVPSEGASNGYEEAFRSRGVDLNQLPFIQWSEWKALQIEAASAVVSVATGGVVKPDWLKKIIPWYPVIDLAAAYAVPTVAAIMWTAGQKGQRQKVQQEPDRRQRQEFKFPNEGVDPTQATQQS